MPKKIKHSLNFLLGLYRIFLGMVILEGMLVLWLLFRIPSEARRALLSGYSRLRIGIGAIAILILFVIIFLLLDSFFSRRILKLFAFKLATILSVDINRTIIKSFPIFLLIIGLPFAEEYIFTSLGGNALSVVGLFIGWFFLISLKIYILYSVWARETGKPVSNPPRVMPAYCKDAFIIFCLLAFAFAYFYQEGAWNGNSRFDLIFAIVQEKRLTIDTFQNQPGTYTNDKAYFNGHYYSDKAIGPAAVGTILYLPIYLMNRIFNLGSQAASETILTYLVIGIPSAFAGSLIYILCWYLSKSRFRAYLVTLAITLGTMYFPYSITFYSHQFTSALLFSAFFLIFFLKEEPEKWKNWYSFLVGSLLGWALISEYQAVIIVLALTAYYLYVLWMNHTYRRISSIVLPILGGLIPVLLQMVYNKVCFGNFLAIGYINESDPKFNSAMAQGIMGIHWPSLSVIYYMTLHPTAGIFWESPALVFSIAGIVYMFLKHRYRAEAILAIWIIGAYLVIMSGYYMWWGGSAVGPRFLIPMLPFFCIFLAFLPRRLNWPFLLLSLVSIGQMIIAAASTDQVPAGWVNRISKMNFFAYSTIYSYCLKVLEQNNFTQNLGYRMFGLESWNSLIPLLVVIGVVTGFFFWKRKEISPDRDFRSINS